MSKYIALPIIATIMVLLIWDILAIENMIVAMSILQATMVLVVFSSLSGVVFLMQENDDHVEITPKLLKRKGFRLISHTKDSYMYQKGMWLLEITHKGTKVSYSPMEMSPWHSTNKIINSWGEFKKETEIYPEAYWE